MDEWIADTIGKMHIHRISQSELAERIGVRRDYLNKILNGKVHPMNYEHRVLSAISEIIEERKQ